jgi:hypothetical protein
MSKVCTVGIETELSEVTLPLDALDLSECNNDPAHEEASTDACVPIASAVLDLKTPVREVSGHSTQ